VLVTFALSAAARLAAASVLMIAAGMAAGIGAQDTVTIPGLEADVAALRSQLTAPALDPLRRESVLRAIASKLNHIGDLRYASGEYGAAVTLFKEADETLKEFHRIAYARKQANLAEAEQLLTQLASDPNPETQPIRASIGRTYVSISLTDVYSEAEYAGDEAAQRKYLARMAEIARENKDLAKQAETHEKLGDIEFTNGTNEKAFEHYETALELRRRAGANEWWSRDKIAYAKWYLGDFDGAVEEYDAVIEQTSRINETPLVIPPGSSETKAEGLAGEREVVRMTLIQALLNTAQINATRGRFGDAERNVTQAREITQKMASSDTAAPEIIKAILTLSTASANAMIHRMDGRLREAMGDDEGAARSFVASADLFSQLSGGAPSGALAGLRARIARIYREQGKLDEARTNIREALRIRRRLLQTAGVALALVQAARIELAAGKRGAATELAREAMTTARETKLDDVIAEAAELEGDIAATEDTSRETAKASYSLAVAAYRKAELRPALARAANSLGFVHERNGELKEAEAAYKTAVEAAEQMRTSFASADSSDAFSDRRDITVIYQRLVDLLVRQGRIEEALQYATRAQRRDLAEATPIGEIKLDGPGAAALARLVAADQREKAALTGAANTRSGIGTGVAPAPEASNALMADARSEFIKAAAELEQAVPELKLTVRPADLKTMQSQLGPREAVVSYLLTPETLFIFVVRRDGISARPVAVGRGTIRTLIARTREGLAEFSRDFYELSSDAEEGFGIEMARPDLRHDDKSEHYRRRLAPVNSALRALYKQMITPIDDLIADVDTLKIIPNAELFLLPMAALVAPDGRYLLEKYSLMFATAGDLAALRKKSAPTSGLVAFGNPTEANLDGALEEVKAIQKVFPASRLYTEDKATKSQLYKLTSAKILHFATHGHIKHPAQASTIQLARLPGITDPDLSYGEIRKLPLRSSEMIVLSACETALGGITGSEAGVFIEAFRGLTNSVAASLWSVDDAATKMLMVEFYRNLAAGQPRAAAMRAAQLKVLRDGRTKNPLFWAPFVLYGDGGRLSGISQRARPRK
jgi:tetratricopeptide (TPR) repeat protein